MRVVLALLICAWGTGRADAQFRPEMQQALMSDATLNDIAFKGDYGCAVGEQGTILQSNDRGETWTPMAAPVPASLRSVCLLTNRIGWIAGGWRESPTGVEHGLLLFTNDGGVTWRPVENEALPGLFRVRFFTLEEGLLVGSRMSPFGTGLLITHDGGKTWEDVSGSVDHSWRTGVFLTPNAGLLAGRNGALAFWGGQQINVPQSLSFGDETIRGVSLNSRGRGWLVGDGGLLLQTSNGGAIWESPPTPLPAVLRDVVDFHTVEQRGDAVWIAGTPGSAIWHSPDAGRTWQRQSANQSASLRSIRFSNETDGWAVGELGQILRTTDAGARWETVRGTSRRAAILSIVARPNQIPFDALARESGEQGYRSMVLLPTPTEVGQTLQEREADDLKLSAAVRLAGGNSAQLGNRLPVALPDVQYLRDDLIADWTTRTDGRLPEILVGGLVAQIRSARPDVILLARDDPNDAVTQVLNQAVLEAVKQAADPTRNLSLAEETGLSPWRVARVFEQTPGDTSGTVKISARQFLPRMNATVGEVSEAAHGMLDFVTPTQESSSSFSLLVDHVAADSFAGGSFFAALHLPAGSDSRRELFSVSEQMLDQLQASRTKRRNFEQIVLAMINRGGSVAQILGALEPHLKGLDDKSAADHLLMLSQLSLERADYVTAEGLLIALVNRYPDEAAAHAGAKLLIPFWCSEEITRQRSRGTSQQERRIVLDTLAVESLLKRPRKVRFTGEIYDAEDENEIYQTPEILKTSSETPDTNSPVWRDAARRNWLTQAGVLGVVLSKRNPALFRDPLIQAALTVANRDPQLAADLDRLYQQVHDLPVGVPANWLNPQRLHSDKKVLSAYATGNRPTLDGVLSDACWQTADAAILNAAQASPADEQSLMMLAYDAEYLYLAGAFRIEPGVAMSGPQTENRRHDAPLVGHDRVSLVIDLDRDYQTYYEIEIDERGWTQERCWHNPVWDPQMFIAVSADDQFWRIEAAIRLDDLVPNAIGPPRSWDISLSRSIPGKRLENWQGTRVGRPGPTDFGLLRFE